MKAGPGLLEFNQFVPPNSQQSPSRRFLLPYKPSHASRATCFSAIDFAIIVPCVRAHLVWLHHTPPNALRALLVHTSRAKPPDALLTLTFLIANRTLPPPSSRYAPPFARARIRGAPGGEWAGRRPTLGRRAPIFFCLNGVVNCALRSATADAVPSHDYPATVRPSALPDARVPRSLTITTTCLWRLLIERGMSWNDTASTDVELQSALQFLIPLSLVCHLCRFSPSALLLCCIAHLPPDWDITYIRQEYDIYTTGV